MWRHSPLKSQTVHFLVLWKTNIANVFCLKLGLFNLYMFECKEFNNKISKISKISTTTKKKKKIRICEMVQDEHRKLPIFIHPLTSFFDKKFTTLPTTGVKLFKVITDCSHHKLFTSLCFIKNKHPSIFLLKVVYFPLFHVWI